ncbi:MAG: TIGR01458 family HAD-type hydrolase [Acidobacteria bacterium]|nr:TIGR01458 family HAD-type hydrolase [Acidobacteriota bacterium]
MARSRIDARGVLLDLDGTVYESGAAIPGAREAIDAIRLAGLPVRFATNTTRRPRRELVDRLRGFGIDVEPEEIITAPIAAATWLAAHGVRRVALHIAEATLAEFGGFTIDDERPDAVVIGDLGRDWTFDGLNRAFRQLQSGAHFVAMQKNRYWQTDGDLTLDAGPFVAALEYATGRDAIIVGKPSAAFFDGAAASMRLPVTDVAVAGDDINSDVRGAMAAGARGVLVRTGKFRAADLDGPGRSPDAVVDSLADLSVLLGAT